MGAQSEGFRERFTEPKGYEKGELYLRALQQLPAPTSEISVNWEWEAQAERQTLLGGYPQRSPKMHSLGGIIRSQGCDFQMQRRTVEEPRLTPFVISAFTQTDQRF